MNEQELVQRALIDVAQDPSSYYQGFVEDQLPLTKNISEEQFISLFSTGDETKTKKVLQELASDKKALTSIVKKFQQKSQASMFKEGGKFDYLKKLQGGEKIPGDRKPKGIKGLFFEATKHPREDGKTGYFSEYVNPEGDTTTIIQGKYENLKRTARNGQQPEYKIAVGSEDYAPLNDRLAIESLDNVHSRFEYPFVPEQESNFLKAYRNFQKWNWGGHVPVRDVRPFRERWADAARGPALSNMSVGSIWSDSIISKQEGGRLTRRQALEDAEKNKGYTRAQARRAYQNAKAGLRAQGYSGSEMREAARKAISGANEPVVEREELPIIATIQAPQGLQYVEQKLNALPIAPNYNNLDFKKRFRLARNAGDKTFNWRGRTYTTQYKEEVLPPEPPKNLVFPGAAPTVPELEFEWNDEGGKYPEKLPIIIDSTDIPEMKQRIYYYNKPYNNSIPAFEIAKNGNFGPGRYTDEMLSEFGYGRKRPDNQNMSNINYSFVYKSGGKLAKENEINKKYIKDSEKAGAEASKEMSDLKAKHKKEISKLKKK